MSALGLLRGVLLCTHLVAIANAHASARAEALAHRVPRERLAPILDLDKLPTTTKDGRTISRNPAHHIQNVLRKRIARGEIPLPETVGVSMAMLMRVVAALAELNQNDHGSFASLTYLSARCDASPSQIRAVYSYLVEHGHALRLSRMSPEDRKVGGAQRPLVATRTTIRPVYALTCDMAETLTEEQVLDLIALGDERPRAKDPSDPSQLGGNADLNASIPDEEERPASADFACSGDAQRDAQTEDAVAGGTAAHEEAEELVWEPAPEHRCLVETLAALSLFTGISLPTGAVEWVADEAFDAGLVELERVDYTHAADALIELHAALVKERRGAEAMGDPPPKIKGGRNGLRSLIISYLKGKRTWLAKHGDVYQARDAARARELAYEALLTPEQRERRGLAPLGASGREAVPAAEDAPRELAGPEARKPPPVAPAPTPYDLAVNRLHSRIALLGARLFAEANAAKRAELETERGNVERELAALLDRGPPE